MNIDYKYHKDIRTFDGHGGEQVSHVPNFVADVYKDKEYHRTNIMTGIYSDCEGFHCQKKHD